MANDEHVAILKKGVLAWNEWRFKNRVLHPDLSGATLNGLDLTGATLARADPTNVRYVPGADLVLANLKGARLRLADLSRADLSWAQLSRANLTGANLTWANMTEADLSRANLSGAALYGTVFGGIDLTEVRGLDRCVHVGPSIVDFQTLKLSGPLPTAFLRGVGFPDRLIKYLPSLLKQAIQYYSCFISYSSKDQAFAERLFADLRKRGVLCWFAVHDLPWGAKTLDSIDQAIRLRDKVLLILSKRAIASDWVEDEVTKAYAEERRRDQIVLLPVRLDNTILKTDEPWASKLRDQRNIGDFTRWKEHDHYQKSFKQLMRALRVEGKS
jgi:uncharacterized protein YjbI with pentapeptide repeats